MDQPGARTSSYIQDGLLVSGSFSGQGNLTIGGCVEGEITLQGGELVVSASGFVEGEVTVRSLSVSGEVRGNVRASERVEIGSRGRLMGEVTTPRIVVNEGAKLSGKFNVG